MSDISQSNSLFGIEQLSKNSLTAVDLFCGAGIGAYGIKKAGYDIVWAVDNDKDAVKTYNLNIGNHAICEDIRKIKSSDILKHDLMIATPVCKPFSVCGARRLTNDEKYGDLLAETIRLFSECRSKALFFENVAGIAMGDSLQVFNDFIKQIESFGYHTYWKIVNSWGSDKGHNGLYLMSHSWFKKYVYQVVVRKKYLNEEELKAYEENPIVLKPWDPMGALAY